MTIADLIDKLQDYGPDLRSYEIELIFPCEVGDALAKFDVNGMWVADGKVVLAGGVLVK
jgi:hypothetical protein